MSIYWRKMATTQNCTKKNSVDLKMRQMLFDLISMAWKRKGFLFYVVLIPLSYFYRIVTTIRRRAYRHGILKAKSLAVPVIVVGNIHVGGSGKTPVVIWLVEHLKALGYHPGVISRGYRGTYRFVSPVQPNSDPIVVGDEPVLIAQRTGCPVWVGAKRVEVGKALLEAHPECNIIISDDGLQHYGLKRDIEIAVIDTTNKFTHHLIPAGPLREPISRLNTVDFIICHGDQTFGKSYQMRLEGAVFYNLQDPSQTAIAKDFKGKTIKALAGIGKPERFFTHLQKLGLSFASVSFEDHHEFTAGDISQIDSDVLIMTEKDAVKCKPFAQAHFWVLPVVANINAGMMQDIQQKLATIH
jgi:tetraacyldisaccharide 4'-kinase